MYADVHTCDRNLLAAYYFWNSDVHVQLSPAYILSPHARHRINAGIERPSDTWDFHTSPIARSLAVNDPSPHQPPRV